VTFGQGSYYADYKLRKGKYNVSSEEDDWFNLQLQGPNSLLLLEKLSGENLRDIRFMHFRTIKINGRDVIALRQGMTGEIGYELQGPVAYRQEIWDTIVEAGQEFGIRRIGGRTVMINHLEACYPTVGKDYICAYFDEENAEFREELRGLVPPLFTWHNRIAGSFESDDVTDWYRSPIELGWAKVWAPVTAAIVIALVGYFGLRPAPTPPVIIAQPNAEGNFAFLVSDEVNAIGDFQGLDLSISKVILHLGGDEEQRIEFIPEAQAVNLTDLQGDRAQEIWRGDVPDGEYSKVFLEISHISGILWDSEEEVEIKLPSGKLQISKPFQVGSGEITNFVYDLTVVEAGQSGQYILKPQIGQSGADQDFVRVKPEGQPEDKGKPEEQPKNTSKPEEQPEENGKSEGQPEDKDKPEGNNKDKEPQGSG